MKDNQLLIKIGDALFHSDLAESYQRALYRVVELHKPIRDEWFNVGQTICDECSREEYTQSYPCLTIQAIQKELI